MRHYYCPEGADSQALRHRLKCDHPTSDAAHIMADLRRVLFGREGQVLRNKCGDLSIVPHPVPAGIRGGARPTLGSFAASHRRNDRGSPANGLDGETSVPFPGTRNSAGGWRHLAKSRWARGRISIHTSFSGGRDQSLLRIGCRKTSGFVAFRSAKAATFAGRMATIIYRPILRWESCDSSSAVPFRSGFAISVHLISKRRLLLRWRERIAACL
jgi:hypothetical protein